MNETEMFTEIDQEYGRRQEKIAKMAVDRVKCFHYEICCRRCHNSECEYSTTETEDCFKEKE